MIKFEDGTELYSEDELPKILTIDELKEFAKKKLYRPKNAEVLKFYKNKENGLLYNHFIFTPWSNVLLDHLLMEICIQDVDKYDWPKMTDYYDYKRIAEYVMLWINPFTWLKEDDPFLLGYLIDGRIATREYNKFRQDDVYKWAIKMLEERETFLGDHTISYKVDSEFEGGRVLKGMNLWSLLTNNPRKYIQFVFENGQYHAQEGKEGNVSYFDTEYFLNNMNKIVDKNGPEKAARIVRSLRKDWKHIVCFKLFNIDKISDQQVEVFRKLLFEGMDYYLEQWDAETPKAIESQNTKKKPTQQNRNHITFTMSGINVGHINMLRQKLIQVGWIAKDTLPDDFYKLFSGKTNSTKITWTGAVGKGMLLFLFQKMVEQGEIVVPDNHSITTILESHFVDKNGIYISGLNSSKESPKHFPVVNECLNILQLEADND